MEFNLKEPPADAIQRVRFSPDSQHLLTASWDRTVRLYDVSANKFLQQYEHDAPVLDVAFEGKSCCWSGGADKRLKKYDFQYERVTDVGNHIEPIKCVEYLEDHNLVVSGGWDSMVKFWDGRSQGPTNKQKLSGKIHAMSSSGDLLVVGVDGRLVSVWDLRMMKQNTRESVLKYRIRCVETFPDASGYVLGSIEGRAAVEYLDPEKQKQKYTFKCHRNKDSTTGMEMIYPIHSISFHRKYGSFATGGADGFVALWDGQNKKRIVQFHRYPTSISSLSFSPDGKMLAIACSKLDIDDETSEVPLDSIFIRHISDQEVRIKG